MATRGARPTRRSCACCASPVRTRTGRSLDATETMHDAPRKVCGRDAYVRRARRRVVRRGGEHSHGPRHATSTSVVSESHTTPRTGACEHSSESQRVRRYARHTSYPDFAGRHVVGRRLWLRRRSPTHPRRSSGGGTAATRGARPARRSCASCASPVRTRRGRWADGTDGRKRYAKRRARRALSRAVLGRSKLARYARPTDAADALVDALCAAAVSVPTDRDVRQAEA